MKRINRIRLEFKVIQVFTIPKELQRINRIRLEFKADKKLHPQRKPLVLIESDWNLKMF